MDFRERRELTKVDHYTSLAESCFFALLGLAAFGFLIGYLFGNSPMLAMIIAAGGLLVMSLFIIMRLKSHSVESLESKICDRLEHEGYHFEKQDGVLYVKRNDNSFHIHLWNTPNKYIKRLYFVYDFGIEDMDKVSPDGWSRLSNSINSNNFHTTFISYNNGFQCRYETAIGNAKDFIKEFDTAYQFIGKAIDDYSKLREYVERDYPNTPSDNKGTIGFK